MTQQKLILKCIICPFLLVVFFLIIFAFLVVEVALEDVLKKLRQHTKVRSHKIMSRLILTPLTFAIFVLGIAQPKHANPRIYLGRFLLLTISITCGPTCP